MESNELQQIFLIGRNWRDDDGYSNTEIDEDYGFYLDRESADAKVEELLAFRPEYERIVANRKLRNAQIEDAYENRMVDYARALKAGLDDLIPKPRLVLEEIPEYEEWESKQYRHFEVVEVERGA